MVRVTEIIGWLLGAVASGIGWYAVSVYGMANYDKAYGPLAIFQIGSALAFMFAITGLAGYAATVAVFGSRQSVWQAIAAGAVFAIAMQSIAFGFDHAMPNGVPWLLPIIVSLLLGAASTRFSRRNEA